MKIPKQSIEEKQERMLQLCQEMRDSVNDIPLNLAQARTAKELSNEIRDELDKRSREARR